MPFLKTILVFLFVATGLFATAQNKPKPKPYKPPVLQSYLGSYQGKISLTRETVAALVKLPLKIIDPKTNKEFSLSSYQIIYKQKTLAEDEGGKMKPSKVITAQLFKSTPLPELWIREISERLLPGEELLFFDIIVKDEKGRVMYAPDLNISIK